MIDTPVVVRPGQTWRRRSGALVTIERVSPATKHEGFVQYCSGSGCAPRHRKIRIARLRKHYTLISESR